MTDPLPIGDHYRAEYERAAGELPGTTAVAADRREALDAFIAAGFPHARLEDWKYTSLAPLEKRRFVLAESSTEVDNERIAALVPSGFDAYRVVVVDGHYRDDLARLDSLPDGADITAFADYLGRDDASIRCPEIGEEPGSLSDMNAALATDGVYVRLADSVVLDKPLHVIHVASADEDERMSQVRHRFELSTSAEATIIEHYVGLGEKTYFCNAVTEVVTRANAKLTRCRLQQEGKRGYHIGSMFAHQYRDSRIVDHAFDLGARLARTGTGTRLAEDNAEIQLYGVYAPTGRQHIDNHTRVDHATEHGISREIYKGVLADYGRGVFNGKIIVHPHAQKTDSDQAANALLLSDNAEVDAKPELEIYADDVTCGHGSTVGQLDESAVFYLKSRGIDDAGARAVLTYSFANTLVQQVGIRPVERFIEAALLAKLPGGEGYADLA